MSRKDTVVFDAKSARHYDENGFLHVDPCHITKEQVVPYYGREIPGWRELGLEADKIYHVYRPAEELEKAYKTFNGLPLLLEHHPESAENPQKLHRVGSLGDQAIWNPPYIDVALHVTDQDAIDAIKDGRFKELSAAYQYDPVLHYGEFDGSPYEVVMTNIRGNHVALVKEGRAGPDVVVADAKPKRSITEWLEHKKVFKTAPKIERWYCERFAQDAARSDDFMEWYALRGIGVKKKSVIFDSVPEEDIKSWITTKTGAHIPILEGETKGQAIKRAFAPENTSSSNPQMKQRVMDAFSSVRLKERRERLGNAFQHSTDTLAKALEKNCWNMRVMTCRDETASYMRGGDVFIGKRSQEFDDAYDGTKLFGDISGHGGVLRHEVGHAIDRAIGRQDGGDFISNVDKDFTGAVEAAIKRLSLPDKTDPQKTRFKSCYLDIFALKYDSDGELVTIPRDERKKGQGRFLKCIPISDIFSAMTMNELAGEKRHRKKYWEENPELRNPEIFANLVNLYGAEDQRFYGVMKRAFPALTDAFERILEKG